MSSLFLFSLILGGGLLAVSLLGDLFGGGDADFDADLDTDLEFDGAVEADIGAGAEVDLESALRIFTIRNLTYFLFGFGAVGWLLLRISPDLSLWLITAAAVAAGGLAAGIATVIFGWLKATDSGWQADEGSFVGCEGRVVLPVGHQKVGTIIVRRGHREYELRALPFPADARSPERWRDVVIIEMDGGTARVSPLEALAPADHGPVNT